MNFISVEGILSTNMFKSIKNQEVLKKYLCNGVVCHSEKNYKMKKFLLLVTVSCPFEQDHRCRFLNIRDTLGCESTVRFLLHFCRGKHKT